MERLKQQVNRDNSTAAGWRFRWSSLEVSFTNFPILESRIELVSLLLLLTLGSVNSPEYPEHPEQLT